MDNFWKFLAWTVVYAFIALCFKPKETQAAINFTIAALCIYCIITPVLMIFVAGAR